MDARTWNCPRVWASACVSSVHTPVALTTCWARTSNVRPDSRSFTFAPVTRSPSRSSPTTRTRFAHAAPYAAAVRTMFMVWRASSTWASQYCTAPTSASGARAGAMRRAARRDRCRCRGSEGPLPSTAASPSYSAMPAPTYGRSHPRPVSG